MVNLSGFIWSEQRKRVGGKGQWSRNVLTERIVGKVLLGPRLETD